MIKTVARKSRTIRYADCCERYISPGFVYLAHTMSPSHEFSDGSWQHSNECADCARRYGRGALIDAYPPTPGTDTQEDRDG